MPGNKTTNITTVHSKAETVLLVQKVPKLGDQVNIQYSIF